MSLEWKSCKIGDVVSVRRGSSPRPIKDYVSETGMPWVKIADATKDQTRFINFTSEFIKEEGIEKSVVVNPGDLIVSNSATPGLPKFMNIKACVHDGWLVFDSYNGILKDFLYYYFIVIRGRLVNQANGSVFKNLKTDIVRNFDINLPDLETQEKIVKILSQIDKKIETTIKINKNLEKTLITIFNSWFINFENYDNSKGMKIDDSYGEIPVDWSVEMLEDYVDFVTGVEPGSKNYHEKPEPNDIPFLRVGDLGSRDNGVFIDPSLSKNKILKYDDIVLSLDATIGIVKMGLEGAYSTGMRKLVIKNDNINQPFLYCLVKSNRIQKIIETFATGTTILHAGKSIKHMNFVLSDKKTMDDFDKIGNPIISIILTNLKEIEYLTNLRDTLLPKLMSGEIDVSKINCDLIIVTFYFYFEILFN